MNTVDSRYKSHYETYNTGPRNACRLYRGVAYNGIYLNANQSLMIIWDQKLGLENQEIASRGGSLRYQECVVTCMLYRACRLAIFNLLVDFGLALEPH